MVKRSRDSGTDEGPSDAHASEDVEEELTDYEKLRAAMYVVSCTTTAILIVYRAALHNHSGAMLPFDRAVLQYCPQSGSSSGAGGR